MTRLTLLLAFLTSSHVVHVNGVARPYRLHVPPNDGRTPLPLVVAFHGAGASALRQERASGLSALADRERFVVVYPEGRDRRWAADARDEAYVRAIVDDVARQTRIDARRVYATGVSNGATMAAHAACTMNDLFAAVATVAGVYRADDRCPSTRPVPVLAIHGLRDRQAPYAPAASWAATWAERNACDSTTVSEVGTSTTRAWTGCAAGADVVFQSLESSGHGWPGDATDAAVRGAPIDASAEIWSFFAAHPMR